MRGVGSSYGFDDVTSLGKQIEDGARSGDKAALEKHASATTASTSPRSQITYE